jgi:hypothetical protein
MQNRPSAQSESCSHASPTIGAAVGTGVVGIAVGTLVVGRTVGTVPVGPGSVGESSVSEAPESPPRSGFIDSSSPPHPKNVPMVKMAAALRKIRDFSVVRRCTEPPKPES